MSQINVQGNTGNVNVKGDTRKNTKITISIGSIVIIAVIAVIFFSKSNTIEKKIIGTWQINEQPQILITFENDGSFSMSGDGDYLDGDYTFLTNNRIQVHMNYMWADFILSGDISINGNKMTINNMSDPDNIFGADGVTITLNKEK